MSVLENSRAKPNRVVFILVLYRQSGVCKRPSEKLETNPTQRGVSRSKRAIHEPSGDADAETYLVLGHNIVESPSIQVSQPLECNIIISV
jgi:hypothetical protein